MSSAAADPTNEPKEASHAGGRCRVQADPRPRRFIAQALAQRLSRYVGGSALASRNQRRLDSARDDFAAVISDDTSQFAAANRCRNSGDAYLCDIDDLLGHHYAGDDI